MRWTYGHFHGIFAGNGESSSDNPEKENSESSDDGEKHAKKVLLQCQDDERVARELSQQSKSFENDTNAKSSSNQKRGKKANQQPKAGSKKPKNLPKTDNGNPIDEYAFSDDDVAKKGILIVIVVR